MNDIVYGWHPYVCTCTERNIIIGTPLFLSEFYNMILYNTYYYFLELNEGIISYAKFKSPSYVQNKGFLEYDFQKKVLGCPHQTL